MRTLFLFILTFSTLIAGVRESKDLLNNYITVNKSLKESLDNELKLIESTREGLKSKVVDTLAKDLVFSNIYIGEEYISSERDLFNNEIFNLLGDIYSRDFKELNSRYAENRDRFEKTVNSLENFQKKLKTIQQKEKEVQRLTLRRESNRFNDSSFKKLDNILFSLLPNEKSRSEINLDSVSLPITQYSVVNNVSNYSILKVAPKATISVVDNGKVVFVEEDRDLGIVVIVKHKNGLFSIYGYLKKIEENITIGRNIYSKETIGSVADRFMFKLTHYQTPIDISLLTEQ